MYSVQTPGSVSEEEQLDREKLLDRLEACRSSAWGYCITYKYASKQISRKFDKLTSILTVTTYCGFALCCVAPSKWRKLSLIATTLNIAGLMYSSNAFGINSNLQEAERLRSLSEQYRALKGASQHIIVSRHFRPTELLVVNVLNAENQLRELASAS